MTVSELRELLADKPDDMPVVRPGRYQGDDEFIVFFNVKAVRTIYLPDRRGNDTEVLVIE